MRQDLGRADRQGRFQNLNFSVAVIMPLVLSLLMSVPVDKRPSSPHAPRRSASQCWDFALDMTVDLHGPVNVVTLLKFMLLTMSVKFSWADSACGPPHCPHHGLPRRGLFAHSPLLQRRKNIYLSIYISYSHVLILAGDDANFTPQDFSGEARASASVSP